MPRRAHTRFLCTAGQPRISRVGALQSLAPLSVRASKQVAVQGLAHPSLQEAEAARYEQVAALFKSEDFVEGPRAFAEKRAPRWKGR